MVLTTAQIDRAVGVLLGTAPGDALGAAYEFGPPRGPELEVAMVGGGAFKWEPDEWTDDTSMAVAIAEVAATRRRITPLFVLIILGVAVGVRFAVSQIVLRPLRRLLEGIDAVGKGDLSRVILAERDDEIGTLAGRFNAMTGSLREAREESLRKLRAEIAVARKAALDRLRAKWPGFKAAG